MNDGLLFESVTLGLIRLVAKWLKQYANVMGSALPHHNPVASCGHQQVTVVAVELAVKCMRFNSVSL